VRALLTVLRLVLAMSEQIAPEDPGEAHERPTIANRAFVSPAVADNFAIKTEHSIPERNPSLLTRLAVTAPFMTSLARSRGSTSEIGIHKVSAGTGLFRIQEIAICRTTRTSRAIRNRKFVCAA